MLRKYYKVKLMILDDNQKEREFKSDNMLDILLSANLKEVDEIIVYRTFSGVFKELITNKKISAITEELEPYSTCHTYNLTTNSPMFFMCNTSIEKDPTRKYPALNSLEATDTDVRDYLYKYLVGLDSIDNSVLLKEKQLVK